MVTPKGNRTLGGCVGGAVIVVALSTAYVGPSARAQSARPPQRGETTGVLASEVLEMKRQYDVAQLKGDGSWFERTLVDDYIFVLPDGTVVTKAEAVNDLSSGDLVWESVDGKDLQARVYGNTAVVTGRFYGKGKFKGKAVDERQRFTSVWIKRGGQWQAISEHATNLKPSEQ